MNNGLIVSVSPHYHKQGATTQRVMRDVLIALIPALIASVIIFGFRSLLLVAVSAANCVLLEFVWNKLFKKEQTIADLSAVVTGVLIAYNVPVTMPIWQLLIGDFIAVIIVKMLFGGLGCNFVNPALVGRLAMMLSFTESMTDYLHTVTAPGVDLLAGATPLHDALPRQPRRRPRRDLRSGASHRRRVSRGPRRHQGHDPRLLHCGHVRVHRPLQRL